MNSDTVLHNLALLAARLTLGATIAAHGAQKLFGAFGGPGPEKAAQMMHSLGFRPGERHATIASSTEMTAGGLMALGLLGPIGPALVTAVMLVAIETVHRPKGYWNSGGGYEMNVMYLTIAMLLANAGYGAFSLDEVIGLNRRTGPLLGWIAIGGGVAAAIGMLAQRNFEEQTTRGEMPAGQKTQSPA